MNVLLELLVLERPFESQNERKKICFEFTWFCIDCFSQQKNVLSKDEFNKKVSDLRSEAKDYRDQRTDSINKLNDMISTIDNGYYLTKSSNGKEDSTSEFMFAITMGYEIKNGKLGRAIKDTTISGIAFDVLKTVDMISSDMSWSSAGMCGKKQLIPVGMGGPAIKCKVNIGGR